MEFTQEELVLIAKASKKSKGAMFVRIILLVAMLIAVGGMIPGEFDSEKLVYVLMAAVFVGVAHPQLGKEPKYEDLVALLKKKSAKPD